MPSAKRPCRPSFPFPYLLLSDSSSDSDYSPPSPPAPQPHPTIPPPNLDALRLWFLAHLSNPYPTSSEKESLATSAGIPRAKIDSDMTNWRRRAGWTDIKDRWAGGDKARMRRLIEGVEHGEEARGEVREEVERMKGYLERREGEKVGEWVHEVSRSEGENDDADEGFSSLRWRRKRSFPYLRRWRMRSRSPRIASATLPPRPRCTPLRR